MGKIIAVTNQKGGVGKTTTAVNLAAALGDMGKKILLVDMDPQGNATSGMGVNKKDIRLSSYEVLVAGAAVSDAIIRTQYRNVSMLPGSINLAGAEIELIDMEDRIKGLRASLLREKPNYDYIFIDCPPSLGLITINALAAADSLLIPIQCEFFALEGLSQLVSTVKTVKGKYNGVLEVEGVLLTMYDSRLNLTVQVAEEVKKHFGDKVFSTVIPRNVRLSEAPSFGAPIMYFDRGSKGTHAYAELARELLRRNQK